MQVVETESARARLRLDFDLEQTRRRAAGEDVDDAEADLSSRPDVPVVRLQYDKVLEIYGGGEGLWRLRRSAQHRSAPSTPHATFPAAPLYVIHIAPSPLLHFCRGGHLPLLRPSPLSLLVGSHASWLEAPTDNSPCARCQMV